MITKVLCQTFRPGSGCNTAGSAFLPFLPLLQILHQFKAVVVGVDTAYIDAEMLRKMPLWSCRLQHTQPHAAMFPCNFRMPSGSHRAGSSVPAAHTLFPVGLSCSPGTPFRSPVLPPRGGSAHLTLPVPLFGKIFRKRNHPVIKIRSQTIEHRHLLPLRQTLFYFFCKSFQTCRFFCFPFLKELDLQAFSPLFSSTASPFLIRPSSAINSPAG